MLLKVRKGSDKESVEKGSEQVLTCEHGERRREKEEKKKED